MNRIKILLSLAAAVIASALFTSCIEDGVTTSAADQPSFSTDTVRMGSLITLGPSPTSRFTVYNRHDRIINISEIAFRDDDARQFRLNVDGVSGRNFSNIEIRPNDSIFVFVEATLAENGKNLPVEILAHIDFRVNGVTSTLPVKATGQDVTRLAGNTRFDANTTLSADRPYLVSDSLVVEKGATLTLPAGTRLWMHDKASVVVYGSLVIEGTPDRFVEITGDRTGFVAASIPYEVMSGQWKGIRFAPGSTGNLISHASIRNSEEGLILDRCGGDLSAPALTLHNSVVRNSKGYIVEAVHSSLKAVGCELTDASAGILRLVGSTHQISQCTIGSYYLFTASGTAIQFEHIDPQADDNNPDDSDLPFLSADIANSIIYGLGSDLSHGDLTGFPVTLRNCLLKSNGSDDDNFLNCLWGVDPLFGVDRDNYIFDYRLAPESEARQAGDASLNPPLADVDMLGDPRTPNPTLGAYQKPRE